MIQREIKRERLIAKYKSKREIIKKTLKKAYRIKIKLYNYNA